MNLETRTFLSEIESKVLQVACELKNDSNYSKEMAIQELVELAEYINESKAPY